jgi:hypothetical protein
MTGVFRAAVEHGAKQHMCAEGFDVSAGARGSRWRTQGVNSELLEKSLGETLGAGR